MGVPKVRSALEEWRRRWAGIGLVSILAVGVLVTPIWLGLILWALFLAARWLFG